MLNPATTLWQSDKTNLGIMRFAARFPGRRLRLALAAGGIVSWMAFTAQTYAGKYMAENQETAPATAKEHPIEKQAPPPWNRFIDILEKHRVPYDADALESAALRAMLRTVDRHAKILSTDAAQTLRRRKIGIHDFASWIENDDLVDAKELEPFVPVSVEMLPHDIVYVKINGLYPRAGMLFSEALTNAAASRHTGLIVDLRQAGGQDLDAVDRIAAFFVDGGVPLYEIRTLAGETLRQGIADNGIPLWQTPAIALTGHQTVRAAELLAAILRDTPGVMLLGARTRGDPKLRELHSWSDNQYLYFPTSVIVPAQHDDYTLVGVMPHILVDDARRGLPQPKDSDAKTEVQEDKSPLRKMPDTIIRDSTLARAVDILTGLKLIDKRDDSANSGNTKP